MEGKSSDGTHETNILEAARRSILTKRGFRRSWQRYALSLALVAATSLVGIFIRRYFSPINLVMLYLLDVVVVAAYLGRGPAILTSIAGVLVFDFFFVPPSLTLAVADAEYLITFLALFVVGLVISSLVAQVREQAEAAQRREAETTALYALSRDLAVAEEFEVIVEAIVAHVGQTFERRVTILLPTREAAQTLSAHPQDREWTMDERESEAAVQAFRFGAPAGRGTHVQPEAQAHYLPLRTARGIVGVLGVKPEHPGSHLTPGERQLLEAFASQSALAIERAQLARAAHQVELLRATERLQTALLNSISHDLRTPLVTITGTLGVLEGDEPLLDASIRHAMVQAALGETERLNRLVENLLDMSRIEAGALRVTRQPCDVEDAVGSALERFGQQLEGRPVSIVVPDGLPLIPLDFVLIVQVLVNVIDNALKYSPAGAPIEIDIGEADIDEVDREVQIRVADRGVGIPPEDLARVFDKFYRVQRPDNVTGTGLGLSIARGIVEAHGGRIWAENRPGGGVTMTIALPEAGSASKRAGTD
jgi:two-component system sensor histidine kinase KdpD